MTDVNEALAPVLPRELTEISDSVRRVSAPPTPILAEPYRLRLIDPDTDADMISEWMNRPHLVEAWEYDWPPARWHRYVCAQLDRQLAPVHRQLSRRATSVTSNSTGRQRIPSPRVMTLIRMTSVCTRPSRTSSSSTAVSDRCCCRASSRISSSSNPVAGESCSTPITATAVPGGCASSPVPRRARHVERPNGPLRVAARVEVARLPRERSLPLENLPNFRAVRNVRPQTSGKSAADHLGIAVIVGFQRRCHSTSPE